MVNPPSLVHVDATRCGASDGTMNPLVLASCGCRGMGLGISGHFPMELHDAPFEGGNSMGNDGRMVGWDEETCCILREE